MEWLAALWLLAEDENAHTANPHLLAELGAWRELQQEPALAIVRGLRDVTTRDNAIKEVAADDASSDLVRSIDALDIRLGTGFDQRFAEARADADARLTSITVGLDTIGRSRRMDRCPVGCDCSFRTKPLSAAAAKWKARCRRGARRKVQRAYLFFGLPLRDDLERYGLNAMFLLSGSAFYAVRYWLDTQWPEIAPRVEASLAGVAHELGGAPIAPRVRTHIELAIRARLAAKLGATRAQYRLLAAARGHSLFDWFAEWIEQPAAAGVLDAALKSLPEALVADKAALIAMGRPGHIPAAINLLLMRRDSRPVLVVPDAWDDLVVLGVEHAWSALRAPLLRYSQWDLVRGAAPVIAFGSASENPAVEHALRGHRALDESLAATTVLALRFPDGDERPWTLAVAVNDPSCASAVTLELAAQVTSTCGRRPESPSIR